MPGASMEVAKANNSTMNTTTTTATTTTTEYSVLGNLVWYHHENRYWLPAVWYPSHQAAWKDEYGASTEKYPYDNSDEELEARLSFNFVHETLNRSVKLPVISLVVPSPSKEATAAKFVQRRIPLTCAEGGDRYESFGVKRGFLKGLIEFSKTQTQEELGDDIFQSYQTAFNYVQQLLG
jgi:hypothetical protein